jgi:hypothetical protein
VFYTERVTAWMANHDYDGEATITQVLGSLRAAGTRLSSCLLANGEVTDEYLVVDDGAEWYLKFYIDQARAAVMVWSCWWQGTAH